VAVVHAIAALEALHEGLHILNDLKLTLLEARFLLEFANSS
jgi:hypothetical protein